MKDNTVTTENGIEVYKDKINYYADEYIHNELEIDHVDIDNKQIIKDNFIDMLFYICDHIEKPDNADIKALDNIFSVYVRLCSKYGINPTLEAFSFLVDIDRTTFNNWLNGQYRTAEHLNTVKKWLSICKGFLVNNLGNSKGTDANKIFIAKAGLPVLSYLNTSAVLSPGYMVKVIQLFSTISQNLTVTKYFLNSFSILDHVSASRYGHSKLSIL